MHRWDANNYDHYELKYPGVKVIREYSLSYPPRWNPKLFFQASFALLENSFSFWFGQVVSKYTHVLFKHFVTNK